eukprot:358787-Prymnesium_polylepis.2
MLAEQMQGEMVIVFIFDSCAVVNNSEVSTKLPQLCTDKGLCSIAESMYLIKFDSLTRTSADSNQLPVREAVLRLCCSPLLRYHSKWRCDSRFGGYRISNR